LEDVFLPQEGEALVERADAVLSLPRHIRVWVAKTLATGYSPESVDRKLIELGYDERAAASEIAEVTASPEFAAAVELAKGRDKLARLLDTLAHQFRRSSAARCVPTLEKLDPKEFFDRYYYGNRPVVVPGLMAGWQALGKWTPEWLVATHGDVTVEVASDRDSDPRYEDNFERHRTAMSLAEFIRAIETSPGNDLYLVSKNRLLDRPELADLRDDFDAPEGFLRPEVRPPGLWFGPGETITPLLPSTSTGDSHPRAAGHVARTPVIEARGLRGLRRRPARRRYPRPHRRTGCQVRAVGRSRLGRKHRLDHRDESPRGGRPTRHPQRGPSAAAPGGTAQPPAPEVLVLLCLFCGTGTARGRGARQRLALLPTLPE
jgi:hypothetical protein